MREHCESNALEVRFQTSVHLRLVSGRKCVFIQKLTSSVFSLISLPASSLLLLPPTTTIEDNKISFALPSKFPFSYSDHPQGLKTSNSEKNWGF